MCNDIRQYLPLFQSITTSQGQAGERRRRLPSFSSNVCAYYMANRPMVSNANVLGITCATSEIIQMSNYTSMFSGPITTWLFANPTKRPQYVILFQDLPSRLTNGTATVSVQYDMNVGFNPWLQIADYFPSWMPFVTSINMNGTGGTNDCIAYINKIVSMATNNPPGALFIGATAAGYGNTNWYFDDTNFTWGAACVEGVTNVYPSASVFGSGYPAYITAGTNVAGYYNCGWDNLHTTNYALDGTVRFIGNSGWYIMAGVDSFNGQRPPPPDNPDQTTFIAWFSSNAFWGTNYSNTPLGAITHVLEPNDEDSTYNYYGNWASGKWFIFTAYSGLSTPYADQVVGDPFVIK